MKFNTYADYDRWVTATHGSFKLEEGALEKGPFLRCTVAPDVPPWKFEWYVIFPDKKYIRAVEIFAPEPKRVGQGASRLHFSFHYGDLPAKTDKRGLPAWDNSNSFDLRIDVQPPYGPHIHYAGENHIPQSRVSALQIADVNVFDFVARIQEHRNSGRSLDEVFGFRVEP